MRGSVIGSTPGMMRAVMPELAWHLEQNTLSRCGLADLVVGAADGFDLSGPLQFGRQTLSAAAWVHPQLEHLAEAAIPRPDPFVEEPE